MGSNYAPCRPVARANPPPLRQWIQNRRQWLRLGLIAASPSVINNRDPNNVTISLENSAANWNVSTTVLTISGVAGVTLVSQTIASNKAASIVLTTQGPQGVLTISDGTNSVTIQVLSVLGSNPPTRMPNTSSLKWVPPRS